MELDLGPLPPPTPPRAELTAKVAGYEETGRRHVALHFFYRGLHSQSYTIEREFAVRLGRAILHEAGEAH